MSESAPTDLSPENVGVVIVDHGSRRQESNDLLLAVAAEYREQSRWKIVEPAHMELAEPSIAAAFARCAEQGARLVVVFPFFLGPGQHWTEDIPRVVADAAAPFPGIRHLLAPPMGQHPLMLEIMNQQIASSLEQAEG